MTWINEELERMEELRAADAPAPTDAEVMAAVKQWWQWFGETLKRNAEQARQSSLIADYTHPSELSYRVHNSEAGLSIIFTLDPTMRTVQFEYASEGGRAVAPEGGLLTLRPRGHTRVAAFLSDQQLHEQDLMRTLLLPVFFPTLPSEAA